MEDVLEHVASQEIERIYRAVEELFKFHLTYLEEGANGKAPNLVIKFPKSELINVRAKLSNFNMNFASSFEIIKGTWEEETRSFFHWFGLVPKITTRFSDNAVIPSAGELIEGWTDQAKRTEPEIAKQVITWLLEQIDCLKQGVNQVQTDAIDRYQARLDKAYQEITLDYESKKNVWQPMQQKAQNLAEEFFRLEEVIKVK